MGPAAAARPAWGARSRQDDAPSRRGVPISGCARGARRVRRARRLLPVCAESRSIVVQLTAELPDLPAERAEMLRGVLEGGPGAPPDRGGRRRRTVAPPLGRGRRPPARPGHRRRPVGRCGVAGRRSTSSAGAWATSAWGSVGEIRQPRRRGPRRRCDDPAGQRALVDRRRTVARGAGLHPGGRGSSPGSSPTAIRSRRSR